MRPVLSMAEGPEASLPHPEAIIPYVVEQSPRGERAFLSDFPLSS